MNNSNLNLARKWRPKNFSEIVGQDLSVSMLKNSLYVKKLFPVYLFSGQRGCGKTSTARIFAAAINCKKLPDFQADAKNNSIPCLTCESCLAMQNSHHPDFIEMDAASHTGVDSVRQIIESCTYMPLSGAKKIYLIDEAHMLSKAAFNAFLKILEEPPTSAIFVMATTELQKIPETVRSRCFQVLFNSVGQISLLKHMINVCKHENITVEESALTLLIQETDGSVRDAINALEQVRFTGETITKELVLKSLGKLSDTKLFELLDLILEQNPKGLLLYLEEIQFATLTAQSLWNMVTSILRALLWVKYEVTQDKTLFSFDLQELSIRANKCSINKLYALLQLLWSQEPLFLQTPQKHLFLEMVLLQMCQQVNIDDLKTLLSNSKTDPNSVQNIQPPGQPATVQPYFQSSHKASTDTVAKATKDRPEVIKQEVKPTPTATSQAPKAFSPGDWTELANNLGTSKLGTSKPGSGKPGPSKIAPTRKEILKPIPRQTGPVDISDEGKWPKANLLTKNFGGRLEKAGGNK